MAIRLIEEYPNRVGAPTADYPHGVPRNKSTPTATDGTPFEQSWFRDQEGFFQGLMETAGITPSGAPDTVLNSDYLDALNRVTNGVIEVDMGGAADVSLSAYQGRVAALKLTGALAADVDLIVPDTERMYWIIDETTGDFSVTVKTAAGTGVKLFGESSAVRSDGTNVVPFVNGMDRRVIYVGSVAELEALSLAEGANVYLTEPRKEGDFVFRAGDFSVQVSADPGNGAVVAPSSDPTGASGAWFRESKGGVFYAVHFLDSGSNDIASGINRAFDYAKTLNLRGVTIYVTSKPGGGYWDWGAEVDMGNTTVGPWVNLEAVGYVPVIATAPLRSFVISGLLEKNDHSQLKGFSFNAGDFDHQAAVWVDRARASFYRDIEIKGDGTGSFENAVVLDGGGSGSGYERCVFENIIDSGDSAFTDSLVKIREATYSATFDGLRVTKANFQHAISNDGNRMNGCTIRNVFAVGSADTPTVIDALIDLSGNVVNCKIENTITNLVGNIEITNMVRLKNAGTLAYGNRISNIGGQTTGERVSVSGGFLSTSVNGVYRGGGLGVPGISGPTASTPVTNQNGGFYLDPENGGGWVENFGEFIPIVDRRQFFVQNDSVEQIKVGDSGYRNLGGLLSISVESTTGQYSAIVHWRTGGGLSGCDILSGGESISATTGVLTGAGTAGTVTISADSSSNSIYVQNNIGGRRNFVVTFLS